MADVLIVPLKQGKKEGSGGNMGKHGETWGNMGKHGETWGNMGKIQTSFERRLSVV